MKNRTKIFVRHKKLHLRRGDKVRVLSGNDKSKEGKILQILSKENCAIVEGCRIVKRHRKPSTSQPEGKIEKKEAPIHMSNLMLVDPSKGVPTRIGRKIDPKTKKLQRYSKKTGEFVYGTS